MAFPLIYLWQISILLHFNHYLQWFKIRKHALMSDGDFFVVKWVSIRSVFSFYWVIIMTWMRPLFFGGAVVTLLGPSSLFLQNDCNEHVLKVKQLKNPLIKIYLEHFDKLAYTYWVTIIDIMKPKCNNYMHLFSQKFVIWNSNIQLQI